MQYILNKAEMKNLSSKVELDKQKANVNMLVNAFKETSGCTKGNNMGYCDDCAISCINNTLSHQVCPHEHFSK